MWSGLQPPRLCRRILTHLYHFQTHLKLWLCHLDLYLLLLGPPLLFLCVSPPYAPSVFFFFLTISYMYRLYCGHIHPPLTSHLFPLLTPFFPTRPPLTSVSFFLFCSCVKSQLLCVHESSGHVISRTQHVIALHPLAPAIFLSTMLPGDVIHTCPV